MKKTFKEPMILKIGCCFYLIDAGNAFAAMKALKGAIEIRPHYGVFNCPIEVRDMEIELGVERVKRGTKIVFPKNDSCAGDEPSAGEILSLDCKPLGLPGGF